MRHKWRHVDEVARLSLGDEFQALPPAQSRDTVDDIDHAFKIAVMVGTRLGLGIDRDCTRPEFGSPGALGCDSGTTLHAQRLRRTGIKLVRANDPHPVRSPPA